MSDAVAIPRNEPAQPTGGDVRIAAVAYASGDGARADAVLLAVANELRAQDVQLAGAVQHNTHGGDRCRCDMTLEDLATGGLVEISEYRGPEARGCRLNPVALEEIVGLVGASLERGADLLIVNKFGKREGEGRGFRQPIETAIASGIPVLVAINEDQLDRWTAFADGLAARLELEHATIARWCLGAVRAVRRDVHAMGDS